jgi:hypothetical protein
MGLAATTFSQFLPDSATSHMRVGPGYVRLATMEKLSQPLAHTIFATDYLTELYPQVLNREANTEELTRWVDLIGEARRTTRPWQFFTSDEYALLASKNNLPAAPPADTHWLELDTTWQERIRAFGTDTYWQNNGSRWSTFTASLYREILQREAGPAEVAHWTLGLTIDQRKRLVEILIDNYPAWRNEPFSEMGIEELRLPN